MAYINMLMEWNTKMNITGAMMSSASPFLYKGNAFQLSFFHRRCILHGTHCWKERLLRD